MTKPGFTTRDAVHAEVVRILLVEGNANVNQTNTDNSHIALWEKQRAGRHMARTLLMEGSEVKYPMTKDGVSDVTDGLCRGCASCWRKAMRVSIKPDSMMV